MRKLYKYIFLFFFINLSFSHAAPYQYTIEEKEELTDNFLNGLQLPNREETRREILDKDRLALANEFTPNDENWSNLTKLTWLTMLFLNNIEITSLPESFGNLTALTGLDLSRCYISSLPRSINKLENLRWINALCNPIYELSYLGDHVVVIGHHPLPSVSRSYGDSRYKSDMTRLFQTLLSGVPPSEREIDAMYEKRSREIHNSLMVMDSIEVQMMDAGL
jgi:hypothetical protein